jgi:CheY-like chemotaxis protein
MVVMAGENVRPSSAGIGWLRNKRILLAEDNITNQMVATQMLDALGAKVDVANDGAEALQMIGVKSYDLFLIDIEMPRVSGLDVIRSIRGSPAPLRDAPVIAVTAYALREHREKIAEAGADGLIPKPLLGIEQFGRDIVNLADQSYRRSEPSTRSAGADDREGPVTMSVFLALEEAIGVEAMGDLLGKIDADLARAEEDVKKAAASQDKAELGAATHVLISVAGAIGAQGLQGVAQKLNAAATGRSEADIAALCAEAIARIGAVRQFVTSRLADGG